MFFCILISFWEKEVIFASPCIFWKNSLILTFLFCRAGYLPQNIPLEIIRYLSEEKDFLPWHAASRALYPLDKLLDRTENYNIFNVSDAAFVSLFLSLLFHCRDSNYSPVGYCKWPRDINFLPNYSAFKHNNCQALVHLHLNSDNCCLRHIQLVKGKVIILPRKYYDK